MADRLTQIRHDLQNCYVELQAHDRRHRERVAELAALMLRVSAQLDRLTKQATPSQD